MYSVSRRTWTTTSLCLSEVSSVCHVSLTCPVITRRLNVLMSDNAPPSTYVSTFLKTLVNNQSCLGPLSSNYGSSPTLCEQVESCNWSQCDSLTDTFCTERKCLPLSFIALITLLLEHCLPQNNALGSDHFCGFCYGDTCAEVSIFPRCQYKGTFGATGSICNLFNSTETGGAVFVGLPTDNQRCIRPTQTVDDCFPPTRCTDTELAVSDVARWFWITFWPYNLH